VAAKRTGRGPAWGKIAAIAVAVALLAAAWRWTPLAEIFTAENILRWTRSVRQMWWAPLALMAGYTAGSFVLFPRPLLTLVSVMTFGVWLGLAYSTAGILIAALVTYYTGRLVKRETLRRLAGDGVDKAAKPVKKHGVVAVFAANMMPTPPFLVQNMVAGSIRIPLWEFMLGTLLALIPGILAWTVFGDQLTRAMDDASSVSWWAIIAAVVLFAGFVYLARRWVRAKGF
jgi:phospholipase D1/2